MWCVHGYHMENYRDVYLVQNSLSGTFLTYTLKTHIPRKVLKTKNFYEFTRCRQHAVSICAGTFEKTHFSRLANSGWTHFISFIAIQNFFSSAHGTFSRRDHILGHKSSLGKFKKIEIISSIFFDHNAMRQDINYGKICKKYKHMEAKQYTTK